MRRITSLLLSVLLALSLFSVNAFAADSGDYVDTAVAVADGVVEVTLTAGRETTNGTLTLAYDADCLTFVEAEAAGTVSTVVDAGGIVTVGYAVSDTEPLAAGTVVAKVRFAIVGRWEASDLTVTAVNFNEETGVNAGSVVTVVSGVKLASSVFEDVDPDAWYYDAVDFVVAEGLFKGLTETTFGPDEAMNRAMFVTVLGRMAGVENKAGQHPFTDVKAGSYYAGYVAWGADNAIVKGVTPTTFAPELNVTREQMATFLYRFAQYLGEDVTGVDAGALEGFADAGAISGYAENAMAWAVSNGLIRGTGAGLEPQGTATRAQAATVLYRLARLLAD